MERLLAEQSRLDAADLHSQMEQCSGPGDVNYQIAIDMSLFKPGASKALPFLEQCASVEFLAEGGLILREVHGYGPGIKVTKAELQKSDHYGVMVVEATGSSIVKGSGKEVVPQRRENRDVKGQSNSALARNTALTITFPSAIQGHISLVLKWGEITGSLLETVTAYHFKVPVCVDTTRRSAINYFQLVILSKGPPNDSTPIVIRLLLRFRTGFRLVGTST